MKIHKHLLSVTLATLAMAPFTYAADSASIYQVALTGMAVPGTGGTFTSFSAPTTNRDVDEDVVLNPYFFIATTSNGNSGAYAFDTVSNTFTDLADTTMAAPTGGNFASFSNMTSGEGSLGFIATDSNGVQGVYAEGYNALALIATSSTSPTVGVTLGNIQNISITGDPYGLPAGIMLSTVGPYEFITNSDGTVTIYPFNESSFGSFGPVSYKGSLGNSLAPGIRDDATAFVADAGGLQGVYYGGPGTSSLVALAKVGSSTPDGSGSFTGFGNPVVTTNEVSFTAHYSTSSGDQQGIFVYGAYLNTPQTPADDPVLRQIVSTGQVAPNSHGASFIGFSDISDTSFDTTFLAGLSDGNEGLYINVNENPPYVPEQIVKVIETGDMINGHTVQSIELAPDASNFYSGSGGSYYSNAGIGFEVDFTDGSEGVYYFDVNLPEPASLPFIAIAIAPFIRRRR